MKETEVVNKTKESYDVYIGRGSKWGNPFKIFEDGNRLEVISKFEEYLRNSPNLLRQLGELQGKKLGCYCKPKPCHGDVLAKYADNPKMVKNILQKHNTIKILACGDRAWNNKNVIQHWLEFVAKAFDKEFVVIIEGECDGADTLARRVAEDKSNWDYEPYPAQWKKHGNAAGPIRNKQMLNAGPDIVVAFHNNLIGKSKGTQNMVMQANKKNVPVLVISDLNPEKSGFSELFG